MGVLAFAAYPPHDVDNAVTRLWDKHMRPDWREVSKEMEAARGEVRDQEAERRTVAEITGRVDAALPVADDEPGLPEMAPTTSSSSTTCR